MNKRTLGYLLLALALLFCLNYLIDPSYETSVGQNQVDLLKDVDGENLGRLKVEQGPDSIELVRENGVWVIPSRGNYPADVGKVRALLLKVLTLQVSQLVTENPAKLDEFGLSDKAVKEGHGRIVFSDPSGKELASLYIGESRKRKNKESKLPSTGQYVRRGDQNKIYLIPDTVSTTPSAGNWLESTIIDVAQTNVVHAQQTKIAGSGEESKEFELTSTGSDSKLSLSGDLPEGASIKDASVTQVISALENLRMSDVLPAGDPAVKDLKFDQRTQVTTSSGLVYSVLSASSGEKFYSKIDVSFDPAVAAATDAKYQLELEKARQAQASKAAATASQKAAEENVTTGEKNSVEAGTGDESKADPANSQATKPQGSQETMDEAKVKSPAEDTPEASVAKPNLSSAADADKLRAKLAPWIFELPRFAATKIRQSRADLIELKAPEPAASSEAK